MKKGVKIVIIVGIIILLFLVAYFAYSGYFKKIPIVGHALFSGAEENLTIYSLLEGIQDNPAEHNYKIVIPNDAPNEIINAATELATSLGISVPIAESELIGDEQYLIYINKGSFISGDQTRVTSQIQIDESNNKIILNIKLNMNLDSMPGMNTLEPVAISILGKLFDIVKNYESYSSELNSDNVNINLIAIWDSNGIITNAEIIPFVFGCGATGDIPGKIYNSVILDMPNKVYTLIEDLNATGTCFTITANNVTIEGNGHTIKGIGSVNPWTAPELMENNAVAIVISGNNTIVKNLVLTSFGSGISSSGANNEISDISYNEAGKVGITASNNLTIKNYDALVGFSFSDALLTFENKYGRLEFQKSITAANSSLKLSDLIIIQDSDINVNTNLAKEFNKPAILKFYAGPVRFPQYYMYSPPNEFGSVEIISSDYYSILSLQDSFKGPDDWGNPGYYEKPFTIRVVGFSDFCISNNSCIQGVCKDNLCVYHTVSLNWQKWESYYDVLNPRVKFNGVDYVVFNDNVTAAKFCQLVTDKTFTTGVILTADCERYCTKWYNDTLKWTGQDWVTASTQRYTRRIRCS